MNLIYIEVQKIDGTTLDTYRMVITTFPVMDKANRVRLFEKTFLVANGKPGIGFRLPFFTLTSADVDFLD